ncbi:PD-(D/E)XK nuclease family protein [Pedobacter sp. MR22-3]|uniref:RecB family exonuclease n=1 Tax=Pedobacter sp. MR22-3 TaxID=2994552 RepID=UPI002247427D|nr:PD-(D/E)XK nuclease family protein [Pedobacter sp. MR22-3]MCX2582725.1 PD-(D/E)XK nuclease family protein [Pedobacter sp. MR22-3]
MIKEIPLIEPIKLKRISPSQLSAILRCPQQAVLGEALERKILLPPSPYASYGTVLHKISELITKGVIRNEQGFERAFSSEVLRIETTLTQSGWGMGVPLSRFVKDYTMKKIFLRSQLPVYNYHPARNGRSEVLSEHWLESKDKTVGGFIDRIQEHGGQVEIIDFKTGKVAEQNLPGVLKTDYVNQLRLYAYLYFEQNGRFPDQLSLVDMLGQKYDVKFSSQECIAIFAEAKNILDKINKGVEQGIYYANPREENCGYCLYRPACAAYLRYLGTTEMKGDLTGSVSQVSASGGDGINLLMDTDQGQLRISGLSQSLYTPLLGRTGCQINIFNLKKKQTPNAFQAGPTTIIYERTEH